MAGYEPKNWKCGDTITADDLNHIEQGVANAGGGGQPLIVKMSKSGSTTFLDHTWQEISDASMAWLEYETEVEGVVATVKVTLFGIVDTGEVGNPSRYQVVFDDFNSQRSFATNVPNGYPQADIE